MPLRSCHQCGSELIETAPVCPACGATINATVPDPGSQPGTRSKGIKLILVIAGCVLILGSIATLWTAHPARPVEPRALSAAEVEAIRAKAEAGDAQAQQSLGAAYAKGNGVGQDYKQAAQWYRQAAEKGNAVAQTALGQLYEAGQGVPTDASEAAKWYRHAAEQGSASAAYQLASLYAVGNGVPASNAEALRWYRLAAQQGDALAQFNLGMRYLEGKGVTPDPVESWKWLALAEAGGVADASRPKALAASRMSAEQMKRARALAAAFKPGAPGPTTAWQP